MPENTYKERLYALMADAIRTTGSDDAAHATFENHLRALRDAELIWSFIDPGVMRMLTKRLHGETRHSMTASSGTLNTTQGRGQAPSSSTSSVDSLAHTSRDVRTASSGKKSTETNAAGRAARSDSAAQSATHGARPAATKTDAPAQRPGSAKPLATSVGASVASYPKAVVFTRPARAQAKQKTQHEIITDNHGRNVETMTTARFADAVEKTAPHFERFGKRALSGVPVSRRAQDRVSTFHSTNDLQRAWKETEAAE